MIEPTDLQDAGAVADLFLAASEAGRAAACRDGCVDRIPRRGQLLATGDIHDNPWHLAKIVKRAALDDDADHHVIFHEVIHGESLVNGMDFSYRMLARIAELKLSYPEQVHVLLGNHELSQIVGSGVTKNGVNCNEVFDAGLEFTFGEDVAEVEEAIEEFIRSMALALRCENGILCAHSLPGPWDMASFDLAVLSHELTSEDYEPRTGSAHRMVWGRRHKAEQLQELAELWGVTMFIIGHEWAETGFEIRRPNTLILNSDHERGVVLPIDLAADPPSLQDAQFSIMPLAALPAE